MMKAFIKQFNSKIYDACSRYGNEYGVPADDIQIMFSVSEEGELQYSVLKDFQRVKKVGILDILNVTIDFKGYSILVPPYIQKIIMQYAEQLSVPATDLSILNIVREKKVNSLLYNKTSFVEIVIDEDLVETP